MRISVIICTYTEKRWATLVATIASVQKQSTSPDEIIVVCDHNPVLAIRLQTTFPDVIVIENTGQAGISAARNTGVARATGDILAFIDDDAVADSEWLSHLSSGYEKPDVLGVGGIVLPEWFQTRPQWFPEEFNWVVGCSYRGLPIQASPVRNFIGCNMSFRREVLAAVDGFQDHLGRIGVHPVGCEETELCIRIYQRWPDGILLYEPEALVQQIVPPDRKNWRYFLSRCFFEGQSKAYMTRLVGTQAGLASERSYTLCTLPSGVLQGIYHTVTHHNWYGIARSSAIISGFLSTVCGYITSSIKTNAG